MYFFAGETDHSCFLMLLYMPPGRSLTKALKDVDSNRLEARIKFVFPQHLGEKPVAHQEFSGTFVEDKEVAYQRTYSMDPKPSDTDSDHMTGEMIRVETNNTVNNRTGEGHKREVNLCW